MTNSTFDTFKKKCDSCGLFLTFSEFYKNKAKADGYQNKCKECIYEYKKQKSLGRIKRQEIIHKDVYFIPDIYIVGYGRTQSYQNSCLSCEKPFFCIQEIRSYQDLFCDNCEKIDFALPEKNLCKVNYLGNVIGWIIKTENQNVKRTRRNFKKVYQRDKYTCQYCGYNLQHTTKFLPLHIDHIKPWSASGGNGMKNLVVACQECNLLVSDKYFNSFEEKKEFILFEKEKKLWNLTQRGNL